jgi:hypothetical protein
MSFFRFNKDVKTKDLKLSDYDQIWTKFCFLDESGSLSNKADPFFTIGIIKLSQPYYLSSRINYERSKRKFYDELKFNKLSKSNLDFAKYAIDVFFDTPSAYFYSYTIDKNGDYFNRRFADDPWQAYEQMTLRVMSEAVLAPKEILVLIADYVTVPKNVKYEVNIKKEMNSFARRLAVAGVCRFDSKGNDILQIVDLLIGAISYDIKLSTGIVSGDKYKIEFLNYLKSNLGAGNFIDNGFKNRNFNIFVDKDCKQRLNRTNEKEPSS